MSIIIIGCGLSGVVIADRITSQLKKKVTIIEKRDHIGGNCYDYIDEETGIRINKYGAHIFHTNNERVWEYINKFSEWIRYEHKVLSKVDDMLVPIPVNCTTINAINNTQMTPGEAKIWLESKQETYDKIENSEQMAKSKIGNTLYDKLIKHYTFKQWNKYPEMLDKSVLERIPIRYDFNPNYFNDKYQALPKYGYTYFFKKLLDNPLITVHLNTNYVKNDNDIVIYTGPIDHYFADKGLPKLEYRSILFDIKHYDIPYFQTNSVINYPSKDTTYTRSVEYKHFTNQYNFIKNKTVVVSETTTDDGEPYYPVPNNQNKQLYEKYREYALLESNVYFVGRLANYKYYNMDEAINNALLFADKFNTENK